MQTNQKEQKYMPQMNEYPLQPNQTQKNGSQQKGNQHEVSIKNKRDQALKRKNQIKNKLNQLIVHLHRQSSSQLKNFPRFVLMLSELQKFNQIIQSQIAYKKKFVNDLKQFCKTISQEEKELITELKIKSIYLYLLQKEQILRHLFIAFPKLQTIIQNCWFLESKHQRPNTKLDLDDENKIQQQNNLKYAKYLRYIIEIHLIKKINGFDNGQRMFSSNQYQDNFLETLSKTNTQIRSLVTQLDFNLMFSSLTFMEIVEFCKLLPNLRYSKLSLLKKKFQQFKQFKQIMLKEYPILYLIKKSEQILHQCFMKVSNQIQQRNPNSQLLDISGRLSLNSLWLNGFLDDLNENENNLVCFLTKKYLQTLKIKEQSQQTLKHRNYQKKIYKKLSKSLEKVKNQLQYDSYDPKRTKSWPKRQQNQPSIQQSNSLNMKLKNCSNLYNSNNYYEKMSKNLNQINDMTEYHICKIKYWILSSQIQQIQNNIDEEHFQKSIYLLKKIKEKEKLKEMCQNFKPSNQHYRLKEIENKEKGFIQVFQSKINSQLVDNQCTILFKQVAKQIKGDYQNQNQQQKKKKKKVININTNIQKKLQNSNQFEKKFKIQEKITKMIEYIIYLVAQAKFDSKTEQTQKGLMNIQDNNQKEGSKLLNNFQEKEKIIIQLQIMQKNYKLDDKANQEKFIRLLNKRLSLLKYLNQQIKFLETKKKEGDIQSIVLLASFSQMMKFQPLNIVQKLERMSRLKLSSNSSIALCVQIKDVQLKLISKIFYLAIKMLQNYFNYLFQRTYGIEQSIIIAYLSKIYLSLKQIIQFQRKKIDENSKGISLDRNQKHRQDFIIASLKEAVQKIQESMEVYSILQKLQNRSGWIQLLQENLECQTIQEAINQLNLHLDNLNYFFQQHIQKMPCLQQDDQKNRKDLEVFVFYLVYISKLIIKTFKLRMNETVSQTEKSENSNILLQDLIFLSENLKEDQFNLKPFNQEQFQINRSQRKKI